MKVNTKEINYDGLSYTKMADAIKEIQNKELQQKIAIIKERMELIGVVCDDDNELASMLTVSHTNFETETYYYKHTRVVTFIREAIACHNKLGVTLKYY